jgi:hypothetical protein
MAVSVLCVCNVQQPSMPEIQQSQLHKPCKGWFYRRHHDA